MKHIFISHAWKYNSDYEKIVQWLNEAKAEGILEWKNYSVPSHSPLIDPNSNSGKYILENELNDQIKPASIVIVIGGMYAAYSNWIEYEIKTAVKYGKYIIAVEPWGQQRVPTIIQNNCNVSVGWNKSSVINAIKKA